MQFVIKREDYKKAIIALNDALMCEWLNWPDNHLNGFEIFLLQNNNLILDNFANSILIVITNGD